MIVDANVLLFAVNTSSRFHGAARSWLEDALQGPTRVGLPWLSLAAFLRIATHPRATSKPLDAETAWTFIDDWLDAETAWVPTPGPQHRQVLRRLQVEGDLRGNLVTDAQIAALAIEYGVSVCSFDSDFARFQQISWINPAQAS